MSPKIPKNPGKISKIKKIAIFNDLAWFFLKIRGFLLQILVSSAFLLTLGESLHPGFLILSLVRRQLS
jgi:hypothetical protein